MPVLQVLAPPSAGVRLAVNPDRPTTIGRDPGCDIVFSKRSLSRRHARIVVRGDCFYLEDCESTNGTYLNGQRLRSATLLQDGDVIGLYDLPLCFSLSDSLSADEDSTQHFAPADDLDSLETEQAVPVYPGGPGASILKGRLNSLISAARQLGTSLDLTDLSRRMLDLLFSMFPQANLGELYLAGHSDELQCVATRRSEMSGLLPPGEPCVERERIEEVLASGQGIVCGSSRARSDDERTSAIVAPILGTTHYAVGVVVLATEDPSHRFSEDDLELVSAVAVLTGQAVAFARSHQLLLKLERTQRHVETAREIQLNMVRHKRPHVSGYRFADYYCPAERVGGDYYFYQSLPDGRAIIGIADASGKGLAAAMAIARFAGEVRFRIATSPTLKKAMSDLNGFVAETGPMTFVTCCICVLDPQAHTLTIANSGHLPPLRRRAGGDAIQTLCSPRGAPPLGIDPDSICHPVTWSIEQGDRILLLTDGVTEAMNPSRELYGTARLKRVLQAQSSTLDACIDAIVADINAFRQGRAASDDMCLVALERSVA